jgi:SAM-dependent methyltransferase
VPEPKHFDDPVLAYDRLAPNYAELAQRRWLYLAGVEREILVRIPKGSHSLLDIGAGNGRRALRIASKADVSRIVLLEPSEEMLRVRPDGVGVWRCRAEDLSDRSSSEKFDLITCLWNVLGHIKTTQLRMQALSHVATVLSEKGKFFMDVNHRYNARSYGVLPTAVRRLRDFLFPGEENGDVAVGWNVGAERINTYGHVFTDREVVQLAHSGGLNLEERVAIDYDNGRVVRSPFKGNLLYVFRRRA